MLPSPIVHPSDETIRQLGITIIQRLFHQTYRNAILRYRVQDIIKLLNYVSNNSTYIPDEIQLPWGDAITTLRALQATLHKFGVRGSVTAQHNKQAIVSSLIVTDENKNILNRKLLNDFVPHKSWHGTNTFLQKCKRLREEFDDNTSGICVNLQDINETVTVV